MSNSAAASGSSCACAAFSYERLMPQVSGSLRMNFFAFGFGVSSISSILGMIKLASSGIAHGGVHGILLGFRGSNGDGIQCRMQRMPWEDRAFDPGRQIPHAGKNGQAAEMMGLPVVIELARRHVAKF